MENAHNKKFCRVFLYGIFTIPAAVYYLYMAKLKQLNIETSRKMYVQKFVYNKHVHISVYTLSCRI